MPAPVNRMKARLAARERSIGCWLGMVSAYTAEIATTAGFDWLLIDGEHAPNDLQTLTAQMQIVDASPADAIIRLPMDAPWLFKQVLDAGAQSLLIPMVESAEQARAIVRATRYPPDGIRGIGSALARASEFNNIPDYLTTAHDQICLIAQVETRAGLDAIEEIAAVDGIDALFIGPSDLAADLGHIGKPTAPEVETAIADAIGRIHASGKAAGILSLDRAYGQKHLDMGIEMLGVGVDVLTLAQGLRRIVADWR